MTLEVLALLIISFGVSPQRMQLVTSGLLLLALNIPPPLLVAVLPLNVQLVTVGLLLPLYIPPPAYDAELPAKLQLVTMGLLL